VTWEDAGCEVIDDVPPAPEGTSHLATCKLNEDDLRSGRYSLDVDKGERTGDLTQWTLSEVLGCGISLASGGIAGGEQVEGTFAFFSGLDRDEPRPGSATFRVNHCGELDPFGL
jgi:hypothetical protein